MNANSVSLVFSLLLPAYALRAIAHPNRPRGCRREMEASWWS